MGCLSVGQIKQLTLSDPFATFRDFANKAQ
jgi:hypothetical protein